MCLQRIVAGWHGHRAQVLRQRPRSLGGQSRIHHLDCGLGVPRRRAVRPGGGKRDPLPEWVRRARGRLERPHPRAEVDEKRDRPWDRHQRPERRALRMSHDDHGAVRSLERLDRRGGCAPRIRRRDREAEGQGWRCCARGPPGAGHQIPAGGIVPGAVQHRRRSPSAWYSARCAGMNSVVGLERGTWALAAGAGDDRRPSF